MNATINTDKDLRECHYRSTCLFWLLHQFLTSSISSKTPPQYTVTVHTCRNTYPLYGLVVASWGMKGSASVALYLNSLVRGIDGADQVSSGKYWAVRSERGHDELSSETPAFLFKKTCLFLYFSSKYWSTAYLTWWWVEYLEAVLEWK